MLTRLESVIGNRLGRYASPALVKALARDVLGAMHSMTPAMLVAAQEAYCTSGQHGHLRTAEAPITQLVDVYHAAIDAALSEPQ